MTYNCMMVFLCFFSYDDLQNILQDKNYITDLSTIKKFLEILALLLITFTIIFFTFFGCFLVLYDSTSRAARGVTLNSEEPAEQGRAHLIRLCKSPLMGLSPKN